VRVKAEHKLLTLGQVAACHISHDDS